MILPDFNKKSFKNIDLNEEAKFFASKFNLIKSKEQNPFLTPKNTEKLIKLIQDKYDVDFTLGGWLEDRSYIWKNSYLQKEEKFIHLGVDINVPYGEKIATDFDALVVKIDDDYPLDGGWGTYIVVKNLPKNVYILYAHLDKEIFCKEGEELKKGQIFAKVGIAPFNGNWFPHVHVQAITAKYYDKIEKENLWEELDGYCSQKELQEVKNNFLDPMGYVSVVN